MNRKPFGVGEWYHCYTRGVDKRRTFQSIADYQRFLQLLYVANGEKQIFLSQTALSHEKIFTLEKGSPLVSIAAYALMPNHFHLLIQEISEGGIAKFMQKLGTGYGMYFNARNRRVGNVFVKPFRSRHVDADVYLKHVLNYIHLNPVELFDPAWKSGETKKREFLEKSLQVYRYSSLPDYLGAKRPEKSILSAEAMEVFADKKMRVETLLKDAGDFYQEISAQIA